MKSKPWYFWFGFVLGFIISSPVMIAITGYVLIKYGLAGII